MKMIHNNVDGSRVEIVSYPNGYRQCAYFDPIGYCTGWFDTKGNFEDFKVVQTGTNKQGDAINRVDYIESSIVKSYRQ